MTFKAPLLVHHNKKFSWYYDLELFFHQDIPKVRDYSQLYSDPSKFSPENWETKKIKRRKWVSKQSYCFLFQVNNLILTFTAAMNSGDNFFSCLIYPLFTSAINNWKIKHGFCCDNVHCGLFASQVFHTKLILFNAKFSKSYGLLLCPN